MRKNVLYMFFSAYILFAILFLVQSDVIIEYPFSSALRTYFNIFHNIF